MTAFHAAFALALEGQSEPLWPHLTTGDEPPSAHTQAALAVYRNTAIKGRIDALEANYPTVAQMVGSEWFRAAAREFVQAEPGDDPVLATYGAGFPEWLARFEPARAMAYLAPTARLDRAWTEAHLAPDATPLNPRQAADAGLALAGVPARLHPSARLFWFDWTVPSLWLAHRDPQVETDLSWRAEAQGLLIHRPDAEVHARRLTRAEWAFLDGCRKGLSFGAAALAAQSTRPHLDVSGLFADLIGQGVFDSTSITSARP